MAILCRGALNDIVDDAGRDAVFASFAGALQPNATLILDVREWAASVERKAREPLFRKRVSTARGDLTFTSVTALDHDTREAGLPFVWHLSPGQRRVSPQHALDHGSRTMERGGWPRVTGGPVESQLSGSA